MNVMNYSVDSFDKPSILKPTGFSYKKIYYPKIPKKYSILYLIIIRLSHKITLIMHILSFQTKYKLYR